MRLITLIAFTVAALSMTACGIPEETHNAVLKDLENIKAELAKNKSALKDSEEQRKKVEDQLTAAGADRDALAKKLGATKMEIEQLRKARALAEQRTKTFRQLLARLKSMISSGKLAVEIRKGRMIVKMSDKILFDPGKIKLKKDGKTALQQLAAVLKDIPNRDFLIAGHTDNVPIKTRRFPSNWELSAARAVRVVRFMQNQGVEPKHLVAAGYSEFDPVGDNSNDDGRRSNRRIEIVLMPNIEELPTIDQ